MQHFSKDEFIKAYYRYSKEIHDYCLNKTSDKSQVQTITDRVFMKAWERVSAGAKVSNLKAFLYDIASTLLVEKEKLHRDLMAFSILSSNKIIRYS
jgi:DNA-directed RNA polymerase specialized sigma24 family protein